MPTMQTDRLLLRMFRDTDIDAYARMCADPQVMRYLGSGTTLTRAEAWRQMAMLVGHWHLRGYGMWAVEERASGQLIGRIGLFCPEAWPGLEIGWMLRRQSWGQGLATEGVRTALQYAFTTLQCTRLISLIAPANTASIRVAERVGERFERQTVLNGLTALVYGISRQQWADQYK